jgi:hypothetical protein
VSRTPHRVAIPRGRRAVRRVQRWQVKTDPTPGGDAGSARPGSMAHLAMSPGGAPHGFARAGVRLVLLPHTICRKRMEPRALGPGGRESQPSFWPSGKACRRVGLASAPDRRGPGLAFARRSHHALRRPGADGPPGPRPLVLTAARRNGTPLRSFSLARGRFRWPRSLRCPLKTRALRCPARGASIANPRRSLVRTRASASAVESAAGACGSH